MLTFAPLILSSSSWRVECQLNSTTVKHVDRFGIKTLISWSSARSSFSSSSISDAFRSMCWIPSVNVPQLLNIWEVIPIRSQLVIPLSPRLKAFSTGWEWNVTLSDMKSHKAKSGKSQCQHVFPHVFKWQIEQCQSLQYISTQLHFSVLCARRLGPCMPIDNGEFPLPKSNKVNFDFAQIRQCPKQCWWTYISFLQNWLVGIQILQKTIKTWLILGWSNPYNLYGFVRVKYGLRTGKVRVWKS